MSTTIIPSDPDRNRFESISDFKWSMKCGAEVQFIWKGRHYYIFAKLQKTPGAKVQMCIGEVGKPDLDVYVDTADEILEYTVSGDRLRDVITQVKVIDRTI